MKKHADAPSKPLPMLLLSNFIQRVECAVFSRHRLRDHLQPRFHGHRRVASAMSSACQTTLRGVLRVVINPDASPSTIGGAKHDLGKGAMSERVKRRRG